MDSLSIRELIDQVSRGQIRIPAFQRGFVWDAERVAYLMDSIYKKYPFGSLMFWRTKEQLKFDRDLGPFKLPEPKEDYPVDYVLDGQQRVTSIFGVFQTTIEQSDTSDWTDIYFDLTAEPTVQDSQFIALAPGDVQPGKHFPLKTLFDTTAYRAATQGLPDDIIKRIDEMQAVFKETKIPVQISKTEDKTTVAIIFERVNRQGVELDTLQLLSAWTWSEEFQLQDQFEELAEELAPFGFADVGGDTDLLLRCCSAILTGDASPKALMDLNGANVREKFDTVTNGVKYGVDYLRSHYSVQTLHNLPFTTLLVPIAVFFAVSGNREASYTGDQARIIDKWFWRSAFSKRYSSGVLRNLKTDIEQMAALRDGKQSSLGDFTFNIDEDFFKANSFGMGNVNTKTFLLMLAKQGPVSFISGNKINLETTLKAANRSEFHHMMPRDFLKKTKQDVYDDNILANICFLSRADNRKLGGQAPSKYRTMMPEDISDILQSAVTTENLFSDDYQTFVNERATALTKIAEHLCAKP
ncbi:GmrSD restriction endonuclease domain-containing protein [Microvirga guangxiensis]|uniref:GmrSD restriction endonucleases N-terminal domain-containing protein n=1 Tax=Microvirga guangxiensis TaxID=549386 RepID=A0A1G5J4I3_9HYPH|nr:DUF262 domain-containing protein [Microvirga guangxiensis]SCY82749.1 hypothetical protein SAMN02927923_02481 [Microvirga guangxiensis]